MIGQQVRLIDTLKELCQAKDISFRPMEFVGDIMTENPMTLTLDHTVKAYIDFMEKHRVRHAPVVERETADGRTRFIGVVSERDVLRQNRPLAGNKSSVEKDKKAMRMLLSQLVERNPKSLKPENSIIEAVDLMTAHHIDMAPVLRGDDIVGVITTIDLLRIYSRVYQLSCLVEPEIEKAESSSDAKRLGVGDRLADWLFGSVDKIMSKNTVSLGRNDTIRKAMEVMQDGKFRHVTVVDEKGKLEGVVSDRDILANLPFAGRRPLKPETVFREHLFTLNPVHANHEKLIENIMIPNGKVKCAGPDTIIGQAASMLRKRKIGCLPVVDRQKKLLGIVTVTDIIRNLHILYE